MGLIRQKIRMNGGIKKKWREIDVIFDSGATNCFIREDVAKESCKLLDLDETEEYTTANGEKLRVTQKCVWEAEIDGKKVTDQAFLLPHIGTDVEMIIGTPTFQRYQMKLEFSDEIGKDVVRVMRPAVNLLL